MTMQFSGSSGLTFPDTSTQSSGKQVCKAWVNFDGTTASPSTIRGSFNVGSITKNGTGDYTVNFSTAMANTNYAVAGNARFGDNNIAGVMRVVSICSVGTLANAMSTTSVRVATQYSNANVEDCQVVCVTVFSS